MKFPPTSITTAVYVANWVLWGLSAVCVALRFVAQRKRQVGISAEDGFMVLALICNLLDAVASSVSVVHGVGSPVQIVSQYPKELSATIYWSNLAAAFGVFGIAFAKIAIAILVNRIFIPRPWIRILNLLVVAVLSAIILANVILLYAQCQPIAHQWNPSEVPGTCLNNDIVADVSLSAGSWGAFTDVYFILYPAWVISKLNMPLRKRVLAGVTMSLCIFTLFTTVYKTTVILPQLSHRNADVTSVSGLVIMWVSIESNVTVMAGSIPTWAWLVKIEPLGYFLARISLRNSCSKLPLIQAEKGSIYRTTEMASKSLMATTLRRVPTTDGLSNQEIWLWTQLLLSKEAPTDSTELDYLDHCLPYKGLIEVTVQ